MRLLYAGDSEVGGAANYLLAILRALRAAVVHLPPAARLTPAHLRGGVDAVILSDFPCAHVPAAAQQAIAAHVRRGRGLLMAGGWGSFSGPLGRWRGSVIERLLPVRCRARDDRCHLPTGALLVRTAAHPLLTGLDFQRPPVLCGFNALTVRPRGRIVLGARRLRLTGQARRVQLAAAVDAMLIVDTTPGRRVAAFATDLAPHWCGGLVDWGRRRLVLPVRDGIQVEVGTDYVRLVSSLVRWLAGAGRSPENLLQ